MFNVSDGRVAQNVGPKLRRISGESNPKRQRCFLADGFSSGQAVPTDTVRGRRTPHVCTPVLQEALSEERCVQRPGARPIRLFRFGASCCPYSPDRPHLKGEQPGSGRPRLGQRLSGRWAGARWLPVRLAELGGRILLSQSRALPGHEKRERERDREKTWT